MGQKLVKKMESSIPEEIVYSDDCDFIIEIERTKDKIYEKAKEIIYHLEKRI